MQRIKTIGGTGSGRSTLARTLGRCLDLSVVPIDPMYRAPGWILRDGRDTASRFAAAAAAECWVFEGNHAESHELQAACADLIVFLDVPRWLRLWRTLKRHIRFHGRTRPDMRTDCPERIDHGFLALDLALDLALGPCGPPESAGSSRPDGGPDQSIGLARGGAPVSGRDLGTTGGLKPTSLSRKVGLDPPFLRTGQCSGS